MDTRFRDSLSGYKVDQVNQFSLVYNEAVSFYFGLYHMGLPRLSEYKGGILPERERERELETRVLPPHLVFITVIVKHVSWERGSGWAYIAFKGQREPQAEAESMALHTNQQGRRRFALSLNHNLAAHSVPLRCPDSNAKAVVDSWSLQTDVIFLQDRLLRSRAWGHAAVSHPWLSCWASSIYPLSAPSLTVHLNKSSWACPS